MPNIIFLGSEHNDGAQPRRRKDLNLGGMTLIDRTRENGTYLSFLCSKLHTCDLSLETDKRKKRLPLTAEQIGDRLWSTYQVLHKETRARDYTIASTVIHDSNGFIISASLGNCPIFIAAYDEMNRVLGVFTLYSGAAPSSEQEENSSSSATTAIVTPKGIGLNACPDAKINITHKRKIADYLAINPKRIHSLKIISTNAPLSRGGEQLIYQCLVNIGVLNSELEAASALMQVIQPQYQGTNLIVLVQTLGNCSILGLYEGMNGQVASEWVANNIIEQFKKQCSLTPSLYSLQAVDVGHNLERFERDNPSDASPRKKRGFEPFFAPVAQAPTVPAVEPKPELVAAAVVPSTLFLPGSENLMGRTLTSIALEQTDDELVFAQQVKRSRGIGQWVDEAVDDLDMQRFSPIPF